MQKTKIFSVFRRNLWIQLLAQTFCKTFFKTRLHIYQLVFISNKLHHIYFAKWLKNLLSVLEMVAGTIRWNQFFRAVSEDFFSSSLQFNTQLLANQYTEIKKQNICKHYFRKIWRLFKGHHLPSLDYVRFSWMQEVIFCEWFSNT